MWDKGLVCLLILLCCVTGLAQAKQGSHFVTAAMRANALANAQKYDWASAAQKSAIAEAEVWLKLSDDDLWKLVTSQELPRAVYIAAGILYEGKKDACPKCGKPISYGGKVDFWKQDWKVTCAVCGEKYPKNDFAAFYQTALDEHGFFRRGLGDKSLLFNTEHPDPNDPLHNVYVDDGYGMTDEKGDKHHMVAYYNYAAQWGAGIFRAVTALSKAYALTSDARYAHKTAVLLDRIADVYPDMDYDPLGKLGFQHSHGGSLQGRIQGNIWETGTADMLSRAYDLVFDGLREVHKIMDADHNALRTLSNQLRTANNQLADKLFAPGNLQAGDLTPQVQQIMQLRQQLMEQGLKTALAIRAVLKPEQLSKVAQLKDRIEKLQTEMHSIFEGKD